VKPLEELLYIIKEIDDNASIAKICMVSPEYVNSWKPRKRTLPNKKELTETGVEPSSGFIAAVLPRLRAVYPQFN